MAQGKFDVEDKGLLVGIELAKTWASMWATG